MRRWPSYLRGLVAGIVTLPLAAISWFWFWIGYASVGAVVEVWAASNEIPGDTISEQFWYLRDRLGNLYSLILFILTAIAAWAIYHFAFQTRAGGGG